MTWEQMLQHLRNQFLDWPTPEIALFEILVIVAAVLVYRHLNARVLRVRQHASLIAVGVFVLEFFTAPMWHNLHLGVWAYVYSDVSWIFTVAWTTMILGTVYLVDNLAGSSPSWLRFVFYVGVLLPLTLVFESLSNALGIREYSPEVLVAAGPGRIPILDVPVAGLYYVPVFMTLVLSFYKHWLPTVEPVGEPRHRPSLVSRLVLTAAAVLLFEIIVEPMATN